MSPRLRACALAAAPGVAAALLAGGSSVTWLLVVLLSAGAGAELARELAARAPRPRAAATEVALLCAIVGALAFVVAWGGRLPLQLEAASKRPAQLLAAAVAAAAAWALFAPAQPAQDGP